MPGQPGRNAGGLGESTDGVERFDHGKHAACDARAMSNGATQFSDLDRADLVVDRIYRGGDAGNVADDPLSKLVPVGNQGGFRFKGSPLRGTVRLVVLYTSGEDVDWPDELDAASGDFTYYGDNKRPGKGLHETPRGGNLLLRDMFTAARGDQVTRMTVPPILLFQKVGTGRDVIFRGLLAPGSPRLESDEELVAVWRTTAEMRFQNYRSHFTVLKSPRVSRAWIDEVLAGDTLGRHCPAEWRAWVMGRIYQTLEAPRTVTVRSKLRQLPDPRDRWMIEQIHAYFGSAPDRFEYMAADLWIAMEPRTRAIDVTRPSRDGGRDAVGKLELGPSEDPVHLGFALEAKCYAPDNGVDVRMVSRLISRIKHREFGVLVTTSYVKAQAYEEVRADGHPVVFVTGRDIVKSLKTRGVGTREQLARYLANQYPMEVMNDVEAGASSRADYVQGDPESMPKVAVDMVDERTWGNV